MAKLKIETLRTDKLAFITTFCRLPNGKPAQPHEAQQAILLGMTRDTDVVTGRQFGKSMGFGFDGAWFAATHRNRQVWVFGPTLDQARIIFNEIARQFRSPNPLSVLVDGKIRDFPFPYFKLSNGTEVHARGANSPQYIRGHHAHRAYCDEASFYKEGVLGDIIEPMFLVAGQEEDSALIKTSTPFGQGEFYESCEQNKRLNGDGVHSYFHYTSYDNPHADRAFLDRQRERYGEDSLRWRTEYLGQFPDSDMAVFPWQDIKAALALWPEGKDFPCAPETSHRYVQGVDLANRRDYFVATLLDVTNPTLNYLVRYDRHQQKNYTFYKELVRSNYRAFHEARTLIDSTTLAESVVEDLRDIGAEGYAFTGSAAKYEVVQELARLFSEHRLAIPYDRDLVDELRYFEYDITPAKVIRMEARRGHDDMVMSLALCAHLAAVPFERGFFMPVSLTPGPVEQLPQRNTPGMDHYDPFHELFMDDEELWPA